jgi:hypothetical protein
MKIFKHIPPFLYILLGYNLILHLGQSWMNDSTPLQFVLFDFKLASGASLAITLEYLLLILGMVTLYIEILKATRSCDLTIVDHTLSTLIFIGFFTQLLLVPSGGTFSFLLLTLMALFDVVAGFTISIANTRNSQFISSPPMAR